MSFDYQMNGLSPDDFLSVGINDNLLFEIESQFIADGVVTNTGELDVSQWAGQDAQLFLGLNTADDNNIGGTIIVDDISFQTVPEPSSLCLAVAAIVLIACRRRRRNFGTLVSGEYIS